MKDDGSFEVGDRVTRPVDVYADGGPVLHGEVIECYSEDAGYDGQTWHNPEVYTVRWDEIGVRRGYFRHGLDWKPRAANGAETTKGGTT